MCQLNDYDVAFFKNTPQVFPSNVIPVGSPEIYGDKIVFTGVNTKTGEAVTKILSLDEADSFLFESGRKDFPSVREGAAL